MGFDNLMREAVPNWDSTWEEWRFECQTVYFLLLLPFTEPITLFTISFLSLWFVLIGKKVKLFLLLLLLLFTHVGSKLCSFSKLGWTEIMTLTMNLTQSHTHTLDSLITGFIDPLQKDPSKPVLTFTILCIPHPPPRSPSTS